jgi:hypothetical protein
VNVCVNPMVSEGGDMLVEGMVVGIGGGYGIAPAGAFGGILAPRAGVFGSGFLSPILSCGGGMVVDL